MDSDVFGPSIPQMMGIAGMEPEIDKKKLIIPIQNYGIRCMSMGSLLKKDSAAVWRGLMVMQAVQTLLRQVSLLFHSTFVHRWPGDPWTLSLLIHPREQGMFNFH